MGLVIVLIMAQRHVVTHSYETPDGARYVDIFQRPDTILGFKEFRRDM